MPIQQDAVESDEAMNTSEENGIRSLERTLEELKSDASIQLKKILMQGKNIKKFQSNVDLLVKRYHIEDSIFDKMANQYGNLSWWIKLLMMVAIVSLAVCIGLTCNILIVLAVVTFIFYLAFVLLFENHHIASLKKDKRIFDDIIALEDSLAESIKHINEIEESLKLVLSSLVEINIQQADDIATFKAQVIQLEEQIIKLTEIHANLESTKDNLKDSTAQIGQAFDKTKMTLSELTHSLSQEVEAFTHTDEEYLKGTHLLFDSHAHLQQINGLFGQSHSDLSNLIKGATELLNSLKAKAETTAALDLVRDATTSSNCFVDITKVIEHAEETMAQATTLHDNYQIENTRIETEAAQREKEFNERSRSTASTLERIATILASRTERFSPGYDTLSGFH